MGVAIIIVVIVLLTIMILGAGFVYIDAKNRNMGAKKWALIAFFYPLLTGVAAYMICRKPLIDLQCPKCGTTLEEGAEKCPGCNSVVLTKCPVCEFPVERGWKACPKCGTSYGTEFIRPLYMHRQDRSHIVTMAIVVVLILTGIALINSWSYSESTIGTVVVGMGNISETDLSRNETIAQWIEECKDSDDNIHILKQKDDVTCIVYVKNSDCLLTSEASFDVNEKGEAKVMIDICETEYEDLYGYDFFLYELGTEGEIKFKARKEYEEQKVNVTTTDEDISQGTWRVSNDGE